MRSKFRISPSTMVTYAILDCIKLAVWVYMAIDVDISEPGPET